MADPAPTHPNPGRTRLRSAVLLAAFLGLVAWHLSDPRSLLAPAGALMLFYGLLSEPIGAARISVPPAARVALSLGGLILLVVGFAWS